MDSDQQSNPDPSAVRKGSPFDGLSRDDLVKKCKGLLGIAQKAKQAKDECLEENRKLKEQLSHFETQKNADKECIKAMQEVADSYMDQKLQAMMKVDALEKQIHDLRQHLDECDGWKGKVEALSLENEAFQRQLKRLTDENEELLADLTAMEGKLQTVGREAQELERKLQEDNEQLEKERISMEQELIKLKGAAGGDSVPGKEERLVRKLKLYKAKVQEINAKLLLLKSDRKILLKTVKEYSEQVPKWQKELVNASSVLFDRITVVEQENAELRLKLMDLEATQRSTTFDKEELAVQLQLQTDKLQHVIQQKEMTIVELQSNVDRSLAAEGIRENRILQLTMEWEQQNEELTQLRDAVKKGDVEKQNIERDLAAMESQLQAAASNLTAYEEKLEQENMERENVVKVSSDQLESLKQESDMKTLHDTSELQNMYEQKVVPLTNNIRSNNEKLLEFEENFECKRASELQNHFEQMTKVTVELQHEKKRNIECEQKLSQQALDLENLEKKAQAVRTELESLHLQQLDALRLENETLTKEKEETAGKLLALERQLHNYETVVESEKCQRETIAAMEEQLQQQQDSNAVLKQQLQSNREATEKEEELEREKRRRCELEEKLSQQTLEIENLESKAEAVRTKLESLHLEQLEALRFENKTLTEQKDETANKVSVLETQLQNYESVVESEKCQRERIAAMEEQLQQQQDSNAVLQQQVQNNREATEKEEEREKRRCDELEEKLSNQSLEIENLKEEAQAVRTELESLHIEQLESLRLENKTLSEQKEELINKVSALEPQLREYENSAGTNICLEEQLRQQQESNHVLQQQMQTKLEGMQEVVDVLGDKYQQSKNENADLLSELKEINEILKERGGVINLQLSKITELQDKLATGVESTERQISELQHTVTERDGELATLREEMVTLREKANVSFDAQSDVMSTSTISRVEDAARMREIDDSFEEKYNKLRSLAVKLKKKVTEQTVLLQRYEKEGATGNNGADKNNLQTLQTENNKLMDELEKYRQSSQAEQQRIQEELDRKTVELSTMLQVREEVDGNRKDRDSLETAIREYQSQIQSLKREKEAFQLAKKELDAENQRLKGVVKAKEKELAETLEAQKDLKAENERAKLAVKKANVLNLEMEAYERSLSDLNSKLEAKKVVVRELEETIETQEKSMKSLKQQVALLEESLDSQQKHSRDLKQEADAQQSKLRQSELQRVELTAKLDDLQEEHERLRQKMETCRVELEEAVTEKEKVCGALELEKNKLLKQTLGLESEVNELQLAVKEKQQEAEDIRTEFASYKIRAQSVLRQNQSKDSSREKELEEERNNLQKSFEVLENKQQLLVKQLADISKQSEELKSDKDRLQNRCKELLNLLEESRLQNESIMEETRKTNLENQEALKTQRLQNETLISCYKEQLDDLRQQHVQELEALQSVTKSQDASAISRSNNQNNNCHPLNAGQPYTDEQRINLLLMEREEGEGSESTNSVIGLPSGTVRRKTSTSSTAPRTRNRELIPLDELLNSSFDETSSVAMMEGENDPPSRTVSPAFDLQHTKEQLSKQESRVRHLTALLAEAEQDLAKLTQLNDMLKEEVRRQQRSIEREAHVHNSEYLKNVIFKFITLGNGDERSRLVPVLNTILKLSPEETQKLQNVAKGTDPGSRGWSGLLWN